VPQWSDVLATSLLQLAVEHTAVNANANTPTSSYDAKRLDALAMQLWLEQRATTTTPVAVEFVREKSDLIVQTTLAWIEAKLAIGGTTRSVDEVREDFIRILLTFY